MWNRKIKPPPWKTPQVMERCRHALQHVLRTNKIRFETTTKGLSLRRRSMMLL